MPKVVEQLQELFISSAVEREVSPKILTEIFVDAYYSSLRPFCKDKGKLLLAFEGAFNPEVFHVASWQDGPVGIVSCRGKRSWVIRPDRLLFRQHLGFVRGSVLCWLFKREYSELLPSSPDGVGHVDCVATRSEFAGRGVATAMVEHIRYSLPFQSVVLEVPNNNPKALRLFTKLGFVESHRIKETFPLVRGFRWRIFLQAPMLEAGGRTSGAHKEAIAIP